MVDLRYKIYYSQKRVRGEFGRDFENGYILNTMSFFYPGYLYGLMRNFAQLFSCMHIAYDKPHSSYLYCFLIINICKQSTYGKLVLIDGNITLRNEKVWSYQICCRYCHGSLIEDELKGIRSQSFSHSKSQTIGQNNDGCLSHYQKVYTCQVPSYHCWFKYIQYRFVNPFFV